MPERRADIFGNVQGVRLPDQFNGRRRGGPVVSGRILRVAAPVERSVHLAAARPIHASTTTTRLRRPLRTFDSNRRIDHSLRLRSGREIGQRLNRRRACWGLLQVLGVVIVGGALRCSGAKAAVTTRRKSGKLIDLLKRCPAGPAGIIGLVGRYAVSKMIGSPGKRARNFAQLQS